MSRETFLMTSTMGVDHYMIEDEAGVRFRASQRLDPILDHNRNMANENDGYSPSRDLRRVASIPFGLIYDWKVKEGWDALDPDNSDRLMRKLNDPEYAYLRTAPGQIGISNGVIR